MCNECFPGLIGMEDLIVVKMLDLMRRRRSTEEVEHGKRATSGHSFFGSRA